MIGGRWFGRKIDGSRNAGDSLCRPSSQECDALIGASGSKWRHISRGSANALNFVPAYWWNCARCKICGKNGGLCENGAIDELTREAAKGLGYGQDDHSGGGSLAGGNQCVCMF